MTWQRYQRDLGKPSQRVIRRADYDRYEREARARQRLQAVLGIGAILLVASAGAALVWLAAWAMVR